MKSGRLRRVIQIQRATNTVNDAGTPVETWADHAHLRAEVIRQEASEFVNAQGAGDVESVVFRTRYFGDVTNADRVRFRGEDFNIKTVAEIEDGRGLEIRCEKLGAG
ncbi:phage head closure protein [Tropicimonas isoalkanivorans]|uniref:Phage head-tail adaptor, putative, SPP1 family n=1 Tax=Tropicimonas isoalkanivorans TaxID=441112 RepID=A0A1I1E520_9RHOB|nr:phage head closure protein [Tropicimonas isoalkanivorans]SFB82261.1 phage head-tail adaptor, putative, SPP1 family [Tropicimonas isoalkanivorans]